MTTAWAGGSRRGRRAPTAAIMAVAGGALLGCSSPERAPDGPTDGSGPDPTTAPPPAASEPPPTVEPVAACLAADDLADAYAAARGDEAGAEGTRQPSADEPAVHHAATVRTVEAPAPASSADVLTGLLERYEQLAHDLDVPAAEALERSHLEPGRALLRELHDHGGEVPDDAGDELLAATRFYPHLVATPTVPAEVADELAACEPPAATLGATTPATAGLRHARGASSQPPPQLLAWVRRGATDLTEDELRACDEIGELAAAPLEELLGATTGRRTHVHAAWFDQAVLTCTLADVEDVRRASVRVGVTGPAHAPDGDLLDDGLRSEQREEGPLREHEGPWRVVSWREPASGATVEVWAPDELDGAEAAAAAAAAALREAGEQDLPA